jgi:exopolyphosphatase/guanosine-5'-triphosphate,3'-diphosphate pyrophosphatase|tara:strand:+ start:1804 stop:2625 length:822 start_codon:yes stop_codon:yes gene_type:complete
MHRVTGLGRGLEQLGELSESGIARTLKALSEFNAVIETHGVQKVRAVATSAARDAKNRNEFLGPASTLLGHPLELLSGEQEARYGFLGATADLDPREGPYLVLDIGGGSTELSFGRSSPEMYRSVNMGSVRYLEQYLLSDPPRPEELSGAIQIARLHLDDIDREHPSMGTAAALIGVAGTITTVAAVEIGLEPYDPQVIDGFVLRRESAEDVFRTLATEGLEDRMHNPGLEAARADVIVAGCCILVAVMRHWNFEKCMVRERDLLDGIAAELL